MAIEAYLNSFVIAYVLIHFAVFSSIKDILGFSAYLQEQFSIIGYGSLDVEDHIYDPSNQLVYESNTKITDPTLEYPAYTDAQWVAGKCSAGYWPVKYSIGSVGLIIMKNVVFTTECVILKSNGYHLFKHACHPRYWRIGLPYHNPHVEFPMYKQVICIGHQHSTDWGHWFPEVLPGLLTIPEDILKNSLIALIHPRQFVFDNLAAVGINSSQLLFGDNKPYFAEKFITISSIWCGDINRYCVVNMKRLMIKRFNLQTIKPERYVLANRDKGMSRHIYNMEEVFAEVRKAFPKFNWEKYTQYYLIHQEAYYFASMKLLWAVHGSLLANEIFMKPGTCVCELQMSSWLLSFINIGTMTGIYQVEGRDDQIKYTGDAKNVIDPKYAARMIEKGLQMLGEL